MKDLILFPAAASFLNTASLLSFRAPDDETHLLMIIPTFAAVVVGVPLWLFSAIELTVIGAICAAIFPFLAVRSIERRVTARSRLLMIWVLCLTGLAIAHFAVHAPTWL